MENALPPAILDIHMQSRMIRFAFTYMCSMLSVVYATQTVSTFWAARLDGNTLTELKYDPSGNGRFETELATLPINYNPVKKVADAVSTLTITSSGRQLKWYFPAQTSGTILRWPISLQIAGYYDRLTGKTIGATEQDVPTVTRITMGGSGQTLFIESFKRIDAKVVNGGTAIPFSGLRNDGIRKECSIRMQTIDGNQFDLYAKDGLYVTFERTEKVVNILVHCKGSQISFHARPRRDEITLDNGNTLPSFAFGNNIQIHTSTGGIVGLNQIFNDFYQQAAFWYPTGNAGMIWGEWGALGHAYVNSMYRDDVKRQLAGQVVGDDGYGRDGYCYSWADKRGWPFPWGFDTRHTSVNAQQICAVRQYLLWTGEREDTRDRCFSIRGLAHGRTIFAQPVSDYAMKMEQGHLHAQTFRAEEGFDTIGMHLVVPRGLGEPSYETVGAQYPQSTRDHAWKSGALAAQPGGLVAQVIIPNRPFNVVGTVFGVWQKSGNGVRLRGFLWHGDYEKALASSPLAERELVNVADNSWCYLALPSTLPARTAILLAIDHPLPARDSKLSYFCVNHALVPVTDEIGASYFGGQLRVGYSLRVMHGLRGSPEIRVLLRDNNGSVLHEQSHSLTEQDDYFDVSLGRTLPPGNYTLEVIPLIYGVMWRGSHGHVPFVGQATVDGHG